MTVRENPSTTIARTSMAHRKSQGCILKIFIQDSAGRHLD